MNQLLKMGIALLFLIVIAPPISDLRLRLIDSKSVSTVSIL